MGVGNQYPKIHNLQTSFCSPKTYIGSHSSHIQPSIKLDLSFCSATAVLMQQGFSSHAAFILTSISNICFGVFFLCFWFFGFFFAAQHMHEPTNRKKIKGFAIINMSKGQGISEQHNQEANIDSKVHKTVPLSVNK